MSAYTLQGIELSVHAKTDLTRMSKKYYYDKDAPLVLISDGLAEKRWFGQLKTILLKCIKRNDFCALWRNDTHMTTSQRCVIGFGCANSSTKL